MPEHSSVERPCAVVLVLERHPCGPPWAPLPFRRLEGPRGWGVCSQLPPVGSLGVLMVRAGSTQYYR